MPKQREALSQHLLPSGKQNQLLMVNYQLLMAKKMKENILKEKSMSLAVRMVNLYKYLTEEKREYVLSKQILRSGTSVGAMVYESEHSESTADFIHKLAITQKEINETSYWLELLSKTEYITPKEYDSIRTDATEVIKLLTSILKTIKNNKQ